MDMPRGLCNFFLKVPEFKEQVLIFQQRKIQGDDKIDYKELTLVNKSSRKSRRKSSRSRKSMALFLTW